MRGHGETTWHPKHNYSIESLVEDVHELVVRLSLNGRDWGGAFTRPWVIVGRGTGAAVASAYASKHKGRVAGCVLWDFDPEWPKDRLNFYQFQAAHFNCLQSCGSFFDHQLGLQEDGKYLPIVFINRAHQVDFCEDAKGCELNMDKHFFVSDYNPGIGPRRARPGPTLARTRNAVACPHAHARTRMPIRACPHTRTRSRTRTETATSPAAQRGLPLRPPHDAHAPPRTNPAPPAIHRATYEPRRWLAAEARLVVPRSRACARAAWSMLRAAAAHSKILFLWNQNSREWSYARMNEVASSLRQGEHQSVDTATVNRGTSIDKESGHAIEDHAKLYQSSSAHILAFADAIDREARLALKAQGLARYEKVSEAEVAAKKAEREAARMAAREAAQAMAAEDKPIEVDDELLLD